VGLLGLLAREMDDYWWQLENQLLKRHLIGVWNQFAGTLVRLNDTFLNRRHPCTSIAPTPDNKSS
jgi:hypothetical protein